MRNSLILKKNQQIKRDLLYREFGVWSLEFGVWSLEFGVWSLEFGVWSLEFGVWLEKYRFHELKRITKLGIVTFNNKP